MLDQKTLTIGGKECVIQQLPSSLGLQVVAHICHIAAGMSKGVGEVPIGLGYDQTPINIGGVISGLLDRLDEEATPAFIKRLVRESVMPEMSPDDYESRFAGNYDELWELVQRIIEYNGFIDVLKKRLGGIMGQFFAEEPSGEGRSTPSTNGQS